MARLTKAEKEPEEFNKRVKELYKKEKADLLAEYKRNYRVNCATIKESKGVLVSGILEAEGWY